MRLVTRQARMIASVAAELRSLPNLTYGAGYPLLVLGFWPTYNMEGMQAFLL